jgi:hypothetical protein
MSRLRSLLVSVDRRVHRRFGLSVEPMPDIFSAHLADYDHGLGLRLEDEANECIKIVRSQTMLPYVRLVSLYQQVVHCERIGVAGDFVECGVWKGGSVGLMALANLRCAAGRRHLHLFDAFDDIPEPDLAQDGAHVVDSVSRLLGRRIEAEGRLAPLKGAYDRFGGHGSLEEVRRLIEGTIGYDPAYLHYHQGFFQETVPAVAPAIGDIAILRLDGDWYASTKVCLDHLFAKVVAGGFVIIDDYGAYDGCRKATDAFLERNRVTAYLHHVDSSCVYLMRG